MNTEMIQRRSILLCITLLFLSVHAVQNDNCIFSERILPASGLVILATTIESGSMSNIQACDPNIISYNYYFSFNSFDFNKVTIIEPTLCVSLQKGTCDNLFCEDGGTCGDFTSYLTRQSEYVLVFTSPTPLSAGPFTFGTFELIFQAMDNDLCTTAHTISTIIKGSLDGTNAQNDVNSVWYHFTASETKTLEATLYDPELDIYSDYINSKGLRLYQGVDCAAKQLVAESPLGRPDLIYNVEENLTYYLQVLSYAASELGRFTLHTDTFIQQFVDYSCESPTEISLDGSSPITTGSIVVLQDPVTVCNTFLAYGWFSFTYTDFSSVSAYATVVVSFGTKTPDADLHLLTACDEPCLVSSNTYGSEPKLISPIDKEKYYYIAVSIRNPLPAQSFNYEMSLTVDYALNLNTVDDPIPIILPEQVIDLQLIYFSPNPISSCPDNAAWYEFDSLDYTVLFLSTF